MKNINEVLIMSKEEKLEQIRLRYNLIEEMVGQLYPSILQSEIIKIRLSL